MPARFVHEPLQTPDTEIRLLELLPGSSKEELQCRLFHSPVSNLPAYQPLSYVWGSPRDVVEILVNNASFFVTRNLAAALRQLQQPDASRILWIDAICINQEDDLEKSRQIPLLTSIYQRGEQTIIWLGPHDPKTARAFEMLEVMARYVERTPKEKLIRIHPDRWRVLKRAMQKNEFAEMEAIELEPSPVSFNPAPYLTMLHARIRRTSVFGRAWFKRVWVIQEIAMSQCAVVVCGKYSTNWETVEKAFGVSIKWQYWEDGKFLQTLVEMRSSIQNGTREDLGSVILKAIYFQATKPVDRIYAILGLADSLPPTFTVDYGTDTNTKFVETTRACLRLTGNVELVLNGCRNRLGKESVFPSWAFSPEPDPEQPTNDRQFHRAAAARCKFQAAGKQSSMSSIHFSDDDRLLFLRGIVFDKIIEVGPTWDKGSWGYPFRWTNFLDPFKSVRRSIKHAYASKKVAYPRSPGVYPTKNETRHQAFIHFVTSIVAMSDGSTDERTRTTLLLEEALRIFMNQRPLPQKERSPLIANRKVNIETQATMMN
jgi:hypothetical protein